MRAAAVQWGIAAAISVSAHLAVAAILARTLTPQPVPSQPPPEARFDLSTQPVEQVTAVAQSAEGATLPEGQVAPPTLPQGTIPLARAAPLSASGTALVAADAPVATLAGQPLQGETMTSASSAGEALALQAPSAPALTARPPPTDTARPAAATAEAASPVSPPDAPRLAPTETGGQTLAGSVPSPAPHHLVSAPAVATLLNVAAPSVPVTSADPPSVDLLASAAADALALAGALPEPEIAPSAAPMSQDVSATNTEGVALLGERPDVPALPTLAPHADHGITSSPPGELAVAASSASTTGTRTQAALAWSGAREDQIDPVSLAAIQSFMQPADLARLREGEDPVRDGITALLSSVPCARMQTVFLPETGTLELRGHVPEEGVRDPVLSALKGQIGGAIPVSDNLRVLPRPQCDVLTGIADLGLPQSAVQQTDPRLVGPDAHAREYHYVDGDALVFEVTSPDYPAHVYIDYFDAAGMVLHLQPNEMLDTVLMAPKSTLVVGSDAAGTEIFSIIIAPPFGNEIAVAFAASTPIHDTPRPVREPAGPYLEWLKDRIAAARASDPDFKGEWVYFFMSTAPRTQ